MADQYDSWLQTLGVPEDSFDQDDSDTTPDDAKDQGDPVLRFVPGVLDSPVGPDPTKPRDCLSLSGSVGKGGSNDAEDVKAVQKELNRHLYMNLSLDGKCGGQTIAAIKTFQTTMLGWPNPDSLVDPSKRTALALAGPRIKGPPKRPVKPPIEPPIEPSQPKPTADADKEAYRVGGSDARREGYPKHRSQFKGDGATTADHLSAYDAGYAAGAADAAHVREQEEKREQALEEFEQRREVEHFLKSDNPGKEGAEGTDEGDWPEKGAAE